MDELLLIPLMIMGLWLAYHLIRLMFKTIWWAVTSLVGLAWAVSKPEVFQAILNAF